MQMAMSCLSDGKLEVNHKWLSNDQGTELEEIREHYILSSISAVEKRL